MKSITITHNQYESNRFNRNYLITCRASDFIFIPPSYPVSSGDAEKMAIEIKRLIDGRGSRTTNIYIGTPGISSANYSSGITLNHLTSFLKSVYNNSNISSSLYRSKIKGVYMNQEAIYGAVNYNNLIGGSSLGNVQIKRMFDLKKWVNSGNVGGRDFIWIPYYGYGSNAALIIKNIGYITDSIQIFDKVILQAHVFFDQNTTNGNFNGIAKSMDLGKVCYRDGVAVISKKKSNTLIGYEMEYDVNKSNSESLYSQYVYAFSNYKSHPQAFYWAGYGDKKTFDKINDWY